MAVHSGGGSLALVVETTRLSNCTLPLLGNVREPFTGEDAALLLGTPVAWEARQVGLLDVLHHATLLRVDKLAFSTGKPLTSGYSLVGVIQRRVS